MNGPAATGGISSASDITSGQDGGHKNYSVDYLLISIGHFKFFNRLVAKLE